MDIKLFPKPLHGTVKAIPSKSHLHRVLIANSLCHNPCEVVLPRFLKATDIDITKGCLKSLGRATSAALGSLPSALEPTVFYCGESASSLRMILPVAAALSKNGYFVAEPSLAARPIDPLLGALETNGFTFEKNCALPPNIDAFTPLLSSPKVICKTSGQLTGGEFKVSGNVSSQFISGLLFALPLLTEDSQLKVIPPFESRSYVNLTVQVLRDFGIDVQEDSSAAFTTFSVKGNQTYVAPPKILIEGDWSNGAFWLAANKLSSPASVTCQGLDTGSCQGDKEIATLLDSMGQKINIANCPDLGPILAVVAASYEGETTLTNAHRLRIKESDRLDALVYNLEKLGAKTSTTKDSLVIEGRKTLLGGMELESFGDHRIVMALAIASISCGDPFTIKNFQAVNKSYPSFFEDFRKLGGEYLLV